MIPSTFRNEEAKFTACVDLMETYLGQISETLTKESSTTEIPTLFQAQARLRRNHFALITLQESLDYLRETDVCRGDRASEKARRVLVASLEDSSDALSLVITHDEALVESLATLRELNRPKPKPPEPPVVVRGVVIDTKCSRCHKRSRAFDDLCKRCANDVGSRPVGKIT